MCERFKYTVSQLTSLNLPVTQLLLRFSAPLAREQQISLLVISLSASLEHQTNHWLSGIKTVSHSASPSVGQVDGQSFECEYMKVLCLNCGLINEQ